MKIYCIQVTCSGDRRTQTYTQFTPQATPDKTVLSVSRLPQRCELDSRQLKTVADRKFEVFLNPLIAVVQFTPQRQTRHRQDCFVVSGMTV